MRFIRAVLGYLLSYVVVILATVWLLGGTDAGRQVARDLGVQLPNSAQPSNSSSSSATLPVSRDDNQQNGSDNQQATARWASRGVTVALAPGLSKDTQDEYHKAIAAWNSAHVVSLHMVQPDQNPNVLCKTEDLRKDATNSEGMYEETLGVTETTIDEANHRIVHADVNIDPGQLRNQPKRSRVWVAEHELGHALGLKHTPEGSHTVMEPINITTGITAKDEANLRALYQA